MSGGGSTSANGQSASSTAANSAMQSGTGGTAGGSASAAMQNIPQWQKGLLGLTTGNPAYGKNAPALHQLFSQGTSMLGGQQAAPQAPMAGGQGMSQQGAAPPGMAQRPMQPLMQGAPMQGGAPQGQGQIPPQLLAQLKQQYPQMFGSM